MHTFHKRRHPRRAMSAKGCLYASKDPIPCTIVDASEQGARLRLAVPAALPARFSLLLSPAEPMLGCERVWQQGEMAGVRFV